MIEGPIGLRREDYRAAIVAATVANAFRGKKGNAATPEDFLPRWKPKREQGPEEQLAFLKAFAERHNRRVAEQ